MKVAKKASEYTIYARNDGRYAVKGKDAKFINGEEKANILLAEGLIKKTGPNPNKPAEEAPAEEGAAE